MQMEATWSPGNSTDPALTSLLTNNVTLRMSLQITSPQLSHLHKEETGLESLYVPSL